MRYDSLSPADEARLMAQADEFEDDLEQEWMRVYGPPEPVRLEPRSDGPARGGSTAAIGGAVA